MASGASTPRSRSRAKRSTTNLANLRLAPLSTKHEASKGDLPVKSPLRTPYDAESEAEYVRKHPSYLQGQSAPTTPGILSRSNSKRHLGGGLSRRGSLYDTGEDADVESDVPNYASGPGRDTLRVDIGSGQIPKAKSEAALHGQQHDRAARKASHRLSGPGVPLHPQQRNNRYNPRGRRSGAATPTQKRHDIDLSADSWLTHTSAMASALVREDKGQSWMSTRQSSTSLAPPTDSEDDDEDDNYEEMAALAASTAEMQQQSSSYGYSGYAYEGGSPVSTRQSRSAWGSRYGSRPASNRTSRLASPVGTRTPRRFSSDRPQNAGYFDNSAGVGAMAEEDEQPGFVKSEDTRGEETEEEENEIARLSQTEGFGLGNVVDKVMNFNLFGGNEGAETTDDDVDPNAARRPEMDGTVGETPEEAKARMEAEKQRRREEKDKLTKQRAPAPLGEDGKKAAGEVSAGWQDASWLLSVAAKALF
ncbi:hypothetical protein CBER1_08950 [Cercospora berteroae]|uniref:Uncharacterized protein n=1 Tax=Cercospora berteroae TaxID=357750 RepID=A0A2S6BVX4_9PEZI|nr:hypothetical protein CBER1_08950 [Cercospora berteroae]